LSEHADKKRVWYERWFPRRLLITEESGDLSPQEH
jgi:hypothetical protein